MPRSSDCAMVDLPECWKFCRDRRMPRSSERPCSVLFGGARESGGGFAGSPRSRRRSSACRSRCFSLALFTSSWYSLRLFSSSSICFLSRSSLASRSRFFFASYSCSRRCSSSTSRLNFSSLRRSSSSSRSLFNLYCMRRSSICYAST